MRRDHDRGRDGSLQSKWAHRRQLLRPGVTVRYEHLLGEVVAVLDRRAYAADSKGHFPGLHRGIVVRWQDGTMAHFLEPEQWLTMADPLEHPPAPPTGAGKPGRSGE